MKKLALLALIMGVALVSSAVGQEFTDVTVGSADPGSTVVTDGVYEVTGNGNDIWDNADAFQYYYAELIGDGSMVARVVDVGEGSNDWAKAGVMIRQSLDAGSMHAITAITGSAGGGAGFQRRVVTDGSSDSNHDLADGPYAPPYWVKTVRVGNDFTGYISADGETWAQVGDAVTIEMADPVLIGLAVTSHAAGELRTGTFDNVALAAASAGWWPLDEGIGETVADLSGNGMDGTINNPTGGLGADGAAWVDDATRGNVFSSDGLATGAYIRAGDIPQMTLQNDFTWAFWAKQAPGNGDNDIIVGNRYNENASDFSPRQFIKFTPTKFEWHMNGNGDDNMDYEDIPDDVWLHHVVVKTGDQLTYYRNGFAASSGVITQALDVAMPLYLSGDNSGADGENWGGVLSDVHTFNEALSQQEIQGIMGGLAPVTLTAWEEAATAAAPSFLATNVEDGIYDIGAFGGEMTYEFLVRSNPDEEQVSMCLIGRRDIGDPQAGLKYEQWNNTGTYGATVFGVADHDYGVATNPGLTTHLVFVASTDAGVTDLYVNGAYQGSVEAAITLSGLVGIGYGAQDPEGAEPFFDDFDGAIYGVAIYDAALSAAQIRVNADTSLEKGPSDITAAGDMVQGIPNDGDWPGAETPDLAIDDDATTKYLHFKGFTEPTGFQVTPMLGATMVTGLTLTTANDAIERDPILFELFGSNESIDGPYELIAAGEIVDFMGEEAWPRFTMNATPITFENEVAYEHYQILFPAVRDPASANSMQIAEVEFIGVPVLPAVPLLAEDF